MDQAYLFNRGEDYRSYNFLGAHPFTDSDGNSGYYFRCWAPNALSVSVIGDFNDWEPDANYMFKFVINDTPTITNTSDEYISSLSDVIESQYAHYFCNTCRLKLFMHIV